MFLLTLLAVLTLAERRQDGCWCHCLAYISRMGSGMGPGNTRTNKTLIINDIFWNYGGGGEIRTHGTLAGTTVFETVAIDHSATPPRSQENPQGVFLGARRLVEAL